MSLNDCCQPGAERRNVDDLAELFDVAVRQIQQRVDVGDTQLVTATAGQHDVVPSPDRSLVNDPKVEPRTMLRDKQIGHFRFVEPQADPKAGDPRLGDLELCAADLVAVADADFIVGIVR